MQPSSKSLVLAVVGVFALMVLTTAPALAVPPSNDNLAAAYSRTAPVYEWFDLTEATLEPGEPLVCENATAADASVWVAVSTPNAATLRFSIDGSYGGTAAGIFGPFAGMPTAVTDLGGPLACVNWIGYANAVAVSATAGATYLVQVSASRWMNPYASLNVEIAPPPPLPPANDNVSGASPLAPSSPQWLDLGLATLEPGETLGCFPAASGTVWYVVSVPEDSTLRVSIDGMAGSVAAGVFGPFDPLPTTAGGTGGVRWCVTGTGITNALHQPVAAGETYLLQLAVSTYGYAWAGVTVDLLPPSPPPPSNDNRGDAEVVAELPFEAWPSVMAATLEAGEATPCVAGVTQGSVWYAYTAPNDGWMSVGLGADTGLVRATVYGIPQVGPVQEVRCVSSQGGPVTGAVRVPVVAGVTYEIQVMPETIYGPVSGAYLVIEPGPPPPEFSISVSTTGSVDRVSGVATVAVTLGCSTEADFDLNVQLRQRLTRTVIASGLGVASGSCGPEPQTIQVQVSDGDTPFGPGFANATVMVAAYDGWQWTSDSTDPVTVKLRLIR